MIKKALLETMDEFHRVYEENNIKYYLIGGSLIGAVRHKGCVPWDDDLDVVMFKNDFKKLLTLKNEFSDKFELNNRAFPRTVTLPVTRIENSDVIIDEGYYSGVKTGVFIDVFCFEDTFESKAFQVVHFKLVAFF